MMHTGSRHKTRLIVTCAKGIVPFVTGELEALGFPVTGEDVAHVETSGTMDDAMNLNLNIRTGQRVLYLLKEFRAATPDELYHAVSDIAWEDIIAEDGYVCVTSSVDTPSIQNTQFANLKCKDAIVDRIKAKRGRRPDSGPSRDKTVIHCYWKNDRCAVYIDTSGEPLHMRGYRKNPVKAPMQETLAAAVVMATGWCGDANFINPMCGSGTLAIEAALIALGRAPGLLRNNFGFMHVKGFNKPLWHTLKTRSLAAAKKTLHGRIIATDSSREAMDAARANATDAGVAGTIEFMRCDFAETAVPAGSGVIILNPEYGERLGTVEELKPVYHGIGDFFKQKCGGYTGYIFTGNTELAKSVGLRTKRKIQFFNSTIECRLLEYELYAGSRKPGTAE